MLRPILVQGRMTPTNTSNFASDTWKLRPNRRLKGGNCAMFGVEWGSSTATVTSVKDDKGNTWTARTSIQDGGNNQSAQMFFFPNTTKGTKEITLVFSAAQTSVAFLGLYEFSDIKQSSPINGTGARRITSGNSLTSGSFVTNKRCLIVQMAFLDSWPTQTTRCTWTRDTTVPEGYKFLTADGCSFTAAQYSVQEAGPQNPALGLSFSATSALVMTEAFEIDEGVGTPREPGTVRKLYQIFPGNINGVITDSTSWSYQVPVEDGADLQIFAQTKNNNVLTQIQDNKANSYAICGTAAKDPSNNHVVEGWFSTITSASEDLVVTLTWTTATGGTPSSAPTVYFREVIGAAKTSPVKQTANANGNTAAQSGDVTGPTLSAPAARGFIFGMGQQDGQTVTSGRSNQADANGGLMSAIDAGQYATDGSEKDGMDWDDYTSDGSSYTLTYTFSNYEGAVAINDFVSQLVSINAAPTFGEVTKEVPGFVTGSPYAYTGEMATGEREFVPAASPEQGQGFVTGYELSFSGEAMTGGPAFYPGATLGPGFVTGSEKSFTGEGVSGAPDFGGTTSVAVGQALETDLAQAITRRKVKALGQVSETDVAQAIARVKQKAIGQALETDVAQPIGKIKQLGLGLATETDLAQPITRGSTTTTVAVGLASETDAAFAITARKVVNVGLATETDTAQSLVVVKKLTLGLASESDVAQIIRPARVRGLGLASETDVAFALTRLKAKSLGLATEIDFAFAISRGGVTPPAAKLLLDAHTGQLYYRFSTKLIIPLS